jgi:hypothetical protein
VNPRRTSRRIAGRLRPSDELLHQTAIAPRVNLEPLVAVADGGHLLDRAGAHRGQRIRDAGTLGGTSHGQLALRIGDAAIAGGGKDQRHCEVTAEQQRGRIETAHVAQHPRLELEPGEGRRVAGNRSLIFGGAIDVVEHPVGQATLGDSPTVVDRHHLAKSSLDGVQRESLEPHGGAEGGDHSHAVSVGVNRSESSMARPAEGRRRTRCGGRGTRGR